MVSKMYIVYYYTKWLRIKKLCGYYNTEELAIDAIKYLANNLKNGRKIKWYLYYPPFKVDFNDEKLSTKSVDMSVKPYEVGQAEEDFYQRNPIGIRVKMGKNNER